MDIPSTSFILAPMEEITDIPFRLICKKMGADVLVSEFAAADALIRQVEMTNRKLRFEEQERPFGIQIFGNTEHSMVEAAKIVEGYHPDFLDINWGCPVKKVALKGGGSGMLQTPELLIQITAAVVKAVKIPVTVKTRLGWDQQSLIIVDLAKKLQDVGISALSIHGRTRSQMYRGEADWRLIGAVKNNPQIKIPIFGNGDICSAEMAIEYKNRYGVDGVMIGRGAIGNPWIFKQCKELLTKGKVESHPSIEERLSVCQQHLDLALKYKEEKTAILEMRKHYKAYFKDIPNFKEKKMELLTSTNIESIAATLQAIKTDFC